MFNLFKGVLFLIFCFNYNVSYSKDFSVSVKIFSGCLISAEDISFGLIARNISKKTTSQIFLHCAKNTNLSLNIEGNNYLKKASTLYPQMSNLENTSFLLYKMSINPSSSPNLSITIGKTDVNSKSPGNNKHSNVSIKTLTNYQSSIILQTMIDVPVDIKSGNYKDTATISIEY